VPRLNEATKERQAVFEGYISKLWDLLNTARRPAGPLTSKIRQMEEGTFVSSTEPGRGVGRRIGKYRLHENTRTKLTDLISKRIATTVGDVFVTGRRLESSGRLSATAMTTVIKLQRGRKLPGSALASHRDQNVDLPMRRSQRSMLGMSALGAMASRPAALWRALGMSAMSLRRASQSSVEALRP